ncbi:MAG: caspase family protein, partial [Desulfobacterales bacterium]|nr:caspase family protein [Desulfobacterales bacterium]
MKRLLSIHLIVFWLLPWCSTGFADARHALLIGVSDYSDTGLPSLEGPPNDLSLIRGVLLDRFGFKDDHITVLLNERASHTGVERAFALLAARVQYGDVVYIHYSGHGSCTPDLNHDEVRTGMDQTWVSHGSRRVIN